VNQRGTTSKPDTKPAHKTWRTQQTWNSHSLPPIAYTTTNYSKDIDKSMAMNHQLLICKLPTNAPLKIAGIILMRPLLDKQGRMQA
jgi:hypothetical protein